jgi:hypothetical protein
LHTRQYIGFIIQNQNTATRSLPHELPDFPMSSAGGISCGIGLKPLLLRGGADEIHGDAHDLPATRHTPHAHDLPRPEILVKVYFSRPKLYLILLYFYLICYLLLHSHFTSLYLNKRNVTYNLSVPCRVAD